MTLDAPLALLHRGSTMAGFRCGGWPTARSVTITGPPIHWSNASRPIPGGQGLTTAQLGGRMAVECACRALRPRLARVVLLHWHLVGDCPGCARDNVVEGGVNKGITIHGTHNASVDSNVVYDLRGASIYVEDGNELHNTISRNVLLCPSLSHKAQLGALVPAAEPSGLTGTGHRCCLLGVDSHRDSDYEEQSAIYSLSATNDFVANRIVGHMNALYVNHQGQRYFGIGAAYGKVCILSSPFGAIEANVFHNNAGFGFYVNVAFPTNVATGGDGHVTSWKSCLRLTWRAAPTTPRRTRCAGTSSTSTTLRRAATTSATSPSTATRPPSTTRGSTSRPTAAGRALARSAPTARLCATAWPSRAPAARRWSSWPTRGSSRTRSCRSTTTARCRAR